MQKVVEVPHIQSNDTVVDVPVMAQRQVLSVEKVQKMVLDMILKKQSGGDCFLRNNVEMFFFLLR